MHPTWKNLFTPDDIRLADSKWDSPKSISVRGKIRMALAYRDNHKCHWCGRTVFLVDINDQNHEATIDHLIPRAKGGGCGEDLNNLVLACKTCNQDKGDRLYPFNLGHVTPEG